MAYPCISINASDHFWLNIDRKVYATDKIALYFFLFNRQLKNQNCHILDSTQNVQ